MSERVSDDEPDSADPGPNQQVESVEAYETDGRTVLYDADNPLAWVETTRALSLPECA